MTKSCQNTVSLFSWRGEESWEETLLTVANGVIRTWNEEKRRRGKRKRRGREHKTKRTIRTTFKEIYHRTTQTLLTFKHLTKTSRCQVWYEFRLRHHILCDLKLINQLENESSMYNTNTKTEAQIKHSFRMGNVFSTDSYIYDILRLYFYIDIFWINGNFN